MKTRLMLFFAQYYLYVALLVSALFFLAGEEPLAVLLLACLFSGLSVIVAKALKKLFGKRRNSSALFVAQDAYAFPSGHAAGLTSLLVSTFGGFFWPFLFVSTGIILFARVKSGVHDYKDILAGVVTGFFVTVLCIGILALVSSL